MFAKPILRADPKLLASCRYFLSGNGPRSPQAVLAELAQYCGTHAVDADRYGHGEFLNAFEAQVAALLGKGAALFLPSGVMAQQIALRIWTDRAGRKEVGLHPTSHLEVNEEKAYAHLHGLTANVVGEASRPFTAQDVRACAGAPAALVLELPYRRLGGVLPSWEELGAIAAAARARQAVMHLDGARLWESQPYYGRSHAEICALFESVYVSFYKGLGGMTGAMLCGSRDFIEEARVWARRHGGNLYQILPYAVSARLNFELRLPRMASYLDRARSLARLAGIAEPHTPMFHVYFPKDPERLYALRDQVAREDGLWLGSYFGPGRAEGESLLEVSIGDASLAVPDELFRRALQRLRS
jgi:threonine aldolase